MTFNHHCACHFNEIGLPNTPEVRKRLGPVFRGEQILIVWRCCNGKVVAMTKKKERLAGDAFRELFE